MKNILAVFITIACTAISAQTPKKVTLQKFGANDLLVIHTQKWFSTLIEFPEGQEILEVTCGDKDLWVVEGKGRFLHVKPAKEGATTNLNVMLTGNVIYSFLLKEVSRVANVKPDLRIVVDGSDEVAKLRKEKDNLEEAFARSEQALKELGDKYDAEKKQTSKKNEVPRQQSDEVMAKSDPAPPDTKPVAQAIAPPVAATGTTPPSTAVATEPEQPLIASSYVVERQGGLVRETGRTIKRFFQKLNHVIHVY